MPAAECPDQSEGPPRKRSTRVLPARLDRRLCAIEKDWTSTGATRYGESDVLYPPCSLWNFNAYHENNKSFLRRPLCRLLIVYMASSSSPRSLPRVIWA